MIDVMDQSTKEKAENKVQSNSRSIQLVHQERRYMHDSNGVAKIMKRVITISLGYFLDIVQQALPELVSAIANAWTTNLEQTKSYNYKIFLAIN
jgi:hypothetical protein